MADGQYEKFTKFSEFVNQLAYLKKLSKDNPSPELLAWITNEAKDLRFHAVMKGFDLELLETESFKKNGWTMTDEDRKNFEQYKLPYDYVKELAELKKQYNDPRSDKDELHKRAQMIRVRAAVDGVDLRQVEEWATWMAKGTKPSAAEIDAAVKDYIAEVEYTAKLIPNSQRWQQAEEDYKAGKISKEEKDRIQAQAHQTSQNIRAEALSKGVNLWEMEKLLTRVVKGREWGKEDYEIAKSYIDKLYEAAGLMPKSPSKQTVDTHIPYKRQPSYKSPFGETYSGTDMVVFFAFPGFRPIEIGTATTVSITTYREKKQIRTIGRIGARGFTKGPRTVSGKIIFTVIREHIVERLRREIPYLREHKTLLMDELPPFDILISFGNEYGNSAFLVINGVTTVDEQKTMSIEEMFTETIFTYLARDYQPLRAIEADPDLPYDPLDWYSTVFRDKGSELVGKFQLDDLILSEYADNLAKALPTLKQNETWTQMSVQDIIKNYYQSLTPIEHLDPMQPLSRKIFVQVLTKEGELVRSGNLKLVFNNSAYNDSSSPWETGPTISQWAINDLDFDVSLIKHSSGYAPGLLVIPDHLGAGEGFTVTYSGYDTMDWHYKPATIKGVVHDGEHTYVQVICEKVADDTVRMIYLPDDLDPYNLENFSYEGVNKIPALSTLTSDNFKRQVQKSADGVHWINLYCSKGPNPYPNAEIQLTWKLEPKFMPGGTTYEKFDRITGGKANYDKSLLTSLPGLQAKYNSTYYTIKSNQYGSAAIRIKDLVFWKDQLNPGKYVYYKDLPTDVLLYIYAKIKSGNDYKTVTCLVRKVDNANDV